MRFTKLYEELTFDDVFPVTSPEEVSQRKEQYQAIRLKEILDSVKKTKLPDGTWHINDDLDVSECGLTTLKDLNISIVDGSFYCTYNILTSLEGCPKKINGSFKCYSNALTSLEGCPTEIKGTFYCDNNKLSNLEGCAKKIDRTFDCSNNKLISLKGCPKEVGRNFVCSVNTKKFTESEVRALCDVKGIIEV